MREALARGVKLLYQRLAQSLDGDGRAKLDALLLPREDLRTVVLTWLRQLPGEPKTRNVLAHLDRLHRIREVKLPANLSQAVHQGRMAQLAREGAQMSAQHFRDLENRRRHAALIAVPVGRSEGPASAFLRDLLNSDKTTNSSRAPGKTSRSRPIRASLI